MRVAKPFALATFISLLASCGAAIADDELDQVFQDAGVAPQSQDGAGLGGVPSQGGGLGGGLGGTGTGFGGSAGSSGGFGAGLGGNGGGLGRPFPTSRFQPGSLSRPFSGGSGSGTGGFGAGSGGFAAGASGLPSAAGDLSGMAGMADKDISGRKLPGMGSIGDLMQNAPGTIKNLQDYNSTLENLLQQ